VKSHNKSKLKILAEMFVVVVVVIVIIIIIIIIIINAVCEEEREIIHFSVFVS
jgi:hypothetical protein